MSQTTNDNTLIQNIHEFAQAAGQTDRLLANSIQQTNQLAVAAGNAAQAAHTLAREAKDAADVMAVSVAKDGEVVTITATDKDGTTTATLTDGHDGQDGAPGDKGDPGDTGPAPAHQWNGTSLQFQNPDGTWGDAVDLRGEQGEQGPAPSVKPWAVHSATAAAVNVSDVQEGALIQTDEPIGGDLTAVIAQVETGTTLSGSTSVVPSSYTVQQNAANRDVSNLTTAGNAALAHAAMPSDQYIDLTLPPHDGTVTAPADGYIHLNKWSSTAGQYFTLYNRTAHFSTTAVTSRTVTDTIELYIPVTKNDVVQVGYNAAGQTNAFRFIYANGSAPTV